jgi:hypothetical protein
MAYADSINYNKIKSMRGYPIGSIIPWSGEVDTIPTGWIACTGATVPVSRYKLLYQAIGNVYGGVVNSTFKIPYINDGSSAIMDIYQGHFTYLQDPVIGDAHKPQNTNKALDIFWSNVGGADNGNRPSSTQLNYISTIDVVGEQISKPDIVASHGAFALSDGDISFSYVPGARKLSDAHIPSHDHDYTVNGSDTDPSSYSRTDILGLKWRDSYLGPDGACRLSPNRTIFSRSLNDPPKNGTEMATVGPSRTVTTNYRAGGGSIIDDGRSDLQTIGSGFTNGDGFSGGNMFSHKSGQKYFFSSLSNDQINFSELTGHTHGILKYDFVSKIKIINPGIVSNVKINTVTIDNTSGVNFGTINMSSATATCNMIFVIKAF